MKGKVSIILLVGIFIGMLSIMSYAQEKPKNELFVVWEIVVHPSKFMDYEAVTEKMVAVYAKYEFPHPWMVYRTEDFHYYFLMPIEKFADIDSLFELFSKIWKKAEKEFMELDNLYAGTVDSENFGVVEMRNDLSYSPKEPRVKTEDVHFIWWQYYYIKAGMEEEAVKVAKEWQALWKSNNVPDYFNVYQAILWSDMPAMVAAGGALSETDYSINMDKHIEKMGDAFYDLSKKTMEVCRRYEEKTGYFMKKMSYTPPKK